MRILKKYPKTFASFSNFISPSSNALIKATLCEMLHTASDIFTLFGKIRK